MISVARSPLRLRRRWHGTPSERLEASWQHPDPTAQGCYHDSFDYPALTGRDSEQKSSRLGEPSRGLLLLTLRSG
jgi:hypothetical protein